MTPSAATSADASTSWVYPERVGLLIWAVIIVGFVGITVLGYRWTRPRPTSADLRRADEAQTSDRADAKTVRERVFMYMSIYGPKR
jgi:hypothetical protein